VSEPQLSAAQPAGSRQSRAPLVDRHGQGDRAVALPPGWARVLGASGPLDGSHHAARGARRAGAEGSAGGGCEAGTADICGVDLKTVPRVQQVAAARAQGHQEQVTRELQGAGVPRDERHAKRRGPRGEWRHTAIARRSRFILGVPWGPRTQERAAWLSAQVGARLGGLPGWWRDGWNAYPAARLQVLGRLSPRRRRGPRGRQPQPRVVPPQDLVSAQGGKVRDSAGTRRQGGSRVGSGGPRRFRLARAARGRRPSIPTAFMERWDGTLRGLGAPLRRRTRGGSSSQRRHHARVGLVVDLYNWVLPHKRVRHQGRPRTPAMAVGRAEHGGSDRDDLGYPVHPDPLGRQRMQQRVKELLVPALEAKELMLLFSKTTRSFMVAKMQPRYLRTAT
jgi:hypothetical protein